MSILNLPDYLQDVVQQNFLLSEFEQGLFSTLAYRQVAEKMMFPNGRGETVTKTRAGYKPAVPTPLNPATNTNLDNGLSPSNYGNEQYTLAINQYADTIDLDLVSSEATIVDFFLQNANANGKQAAQTLDFLARNALLDAYMGGNTYVITALTGASTTLHVNDVRGFENVIVNGKSVPVSGTNTMEVNVNGTAYTLVGVARDVVNASDARFQTFVNPFTGLTQTNYGLGVGGVSGVLTFQSAVAQSDGALHNPVISAFASTILRPNARNSTAALQAGDTLTMQVILDAVAELRSNGVPDVNGKYNCYLDHQSANQLFTDPAFQILYRGATLTDPSYQNAEVVNGLDVRFIRSTQAPQQALGSFNIRRPIICGDKVLIEGTFEGQTAAAERMTQGMGYIEVVDDVVQIIRPQLDRLQQIIAQSWFWIGGYVAPTDATATNYIIPTANNAYYKRAIVIETV